MPALKWMRLADLEFKTSLNYIVSSRPSDLHNNTLFKPLPTVHKVKNNTEIIIK